MILARLQYRGGDQHQRLIRHLPLGLGFSTSQDFNGDIALVACFASAWTPAMVRRWQADPFGFLRPVQRRSCWNQAALARRDYAPCAILGNRLPRLTVTYFLREAVWIRLAACT
jgi:hypothetical protein